MFQSASFCRAASISSLIAAFALKVSPDLTAFTVRIGRDSFDETPHAVEVARHLGIRHQLVEFR